MLFLILSFLFDFYSIFLINKRSFWAYSRFVSLFFIQWTIFYFASSLFSSDWWERKSDLVSYWIQTLLVNEVLLQIYASYINAKCRLFPQNYKTSYLNPNKVLHICLWICPNNHRWIGKSSVLEISLWLPQVYNSSLIDVGNIRIPYLPLCTLINSSE